MEARHICLSCASKKEGIWRNTHGILWGECAVCGTYAGVADQAGWDWNTPVDGALFAYVVDDITLTKIEIEQEHSGMIKLSLGQGWVRKRPESGPQYFTERLAAEAYLEAWIESELVVARARVDELTKKRGTTDEKDPQEI